MKQVILNTLKTDQVLLIVPICLEVHLGVGQGRRRITEELLLHQDQDLGAEKELLKERVQGQDLGLDQILRGVKTLGVMIGVRKVEILDHQCLTEEGIMVTEKSLSRTSA